MTSQGRANIRVGYDSHALFCTLTEHLQLALLGINIIRSQATQFRNPEPRRRQNKQDEMQLLADKLESRAQARSRSSSPLGMVFGNRLGRFILNLIRENTS